MPDKTPDAAGAAAANQGFAGWLVVGAAGVGLLFVVSVHFPDSVKIPGLFTVALAAAAGFGLGHWGTAMNVRPTLAMALSAWLVIGGSGVIAAIKTNRDRVHSLQKQPKYRNAPEDPIIEGLKRALDTEPTPQNEKDRQRLQRIRDDVELGESKRREWLEQLTFYGFLKGRIPDAWGKWSYPWPAVFWGVEIVLGSTLGAWLTLYTLRHAPPREPTITSQAPGPPCGAG